MPWPALDCTPGHRMGIYTARPAPSPSHDAMLLLDMTAARTESAPSGQQP
ncbi:hypothetical protein ACIBTP_08760 [Streptomyces avidinii]